MKRCPTCRHTYSDETIKFCRLDGAPLISDLSLESSETAILSSTHRNAEIPTRLLQNIPSIAVLAFVNMSTDPENDYFCDGLAEELLNALAKVENLKVVARTSSFSFKGKDVNIGEISRVLSVSTVLEGSVRKAGNRVRITVQLVNASDGYQLWSERYDREMQDIFEVQDEITLSVVDALKVKLLGQEKAVLIKRYTDKPEAYELYLKGRYHLHKHTGEGWLKAIGFFEQAVEKEAEYAPAYAGLSSALAFCWLFSVLPADGAVSQWKAATVRALEIDDNLDEAHTAFGQLRFYYEWNWEEARREYLQAIKINPNNADAHHQYGLFLVCMGQFDEAIIEGLRALELDPLSLLVNLQVGWIYLHSGRLDDVIWQDQKMLEIEPNFHGAYWQMGIAYVAKGMYEEALDAYRKALALGSYQHVLSSLGAVYANLGRRDEAFDALNQLLEIRTVSPFNIARIYSCLGETDQAIEYLGKAYEERSGEMVFLNVETKVGTGNIFGKSIRQDKRFRDLLRRVGLTP